MFFVTKNGRVTTIKPDEDFLEVNEYPVVPYRQGYIGAISGFSGNEVSYTYYPEKVEPEPTETERMMQGFTDSELRDLEIQQNQELLAQQITDIEVALLGGGK